MSRPLDKKLLDDLIAGRHVAPDPPSPPVERKPVTHRVPAINVTPSPPPPRRAPVSSDGRCPHAQDGKHKWAWSKGVKKCWLCEQLAPTDEKPDWHRKVYGGGR